MVSWDWSREWRRVGEGREGGESDGDDCWDGCVRLVRIRVVVWWNRGMMEYWWRRVVCH